MRLSVICAGLFGLSVAVDQADLVSGYHYQGCAVVDLECFSQPVITDGGRITHAACQLACRGSLYAALFPRACRCGNDTAAVLPKDEGLCDYPCMGDPAYGMCGSDCPGSSPNTSNVLALPPPAKKDVPGSGSVSAIPDSSVGTVASVTRIFTATSSATQTLTLTSLKLSSSEPPSAPSSSTHQTSTMGSESLVPFSASATVDQSSRPESRPTLPVSHQGHGHSVTQEPSTSRLPPVTVPTSTAMTCLPTLALAIMLMFGVAI